MTPKQKMYAAANQFIKIQYGNTQVYHHRALSELGAFVAGYKAALNDLIPVLDEASHSKLLSIIESCQNEIKK